MGQKIRAPRSKIGGPRRENHGKRNLPAWKRIGDREQTRITIREYEGIVAQLAKEHDALNENLQAVIAVLDNLVNARNLDNGRINMLVTQQAVLKRVLLEIGHQHSTVLGRQMDFDEEAFTRIVGIVLRERAEEAQALREQLDAQERRDRHVACQWCGQDSLDDSFPVASCCLPAEDGSKACGRLTPTGVGEALRQGMLPEWPEIAGESSDACRESPPFDYRTPVASETVSGEAAVA